MTKRKLSIFDFDGTLVKSPVDSKENKEKWVEYHGKPWPYNGWWSHDESLDTDVWEMPVVEEVFNDYQTELRNPEVVLVLLTGRAQKQSEIVKEIVNDRGYHFNHYLFNRGGSTLSGKIKHLLYLLDKYPSIRDIEMWDDRPSHFKEFEEFGRRLKKMGRIDSFYLNKIESGHW